MFHQASTLVFKIERCELEIAKAAQRARQVLTYLEGPENSGGCGGTGKRSSTTVGSWEAVGGCADVRATKTPRPRDRNKGMCNEGPSMGVSGGFGGTPSASSICLPQGHIPCSKELVKVLRDLIAGADAMVARRRDAVGKSKNDTPLGSHRRGVQRVHCRKRRRSQPGDGDHKVREEERSDGDQGEIEGGDFVDRSGNPDKGDSRSRGGTRLLSRRRSSSRARVRSRNPIIDGWLQEGGADGDGADAFVDLEDFIVD